jgi:hypothetical protein
MASKRPSGGSATAWPKRGIVALDLHTVADVLTLVREVFPEEEPPARLGLLLEDIFGRSD